MTLSNRQRRLQRKTVRAEPRTAPSSDDRQRVKQSKNAETQTVLQKLRAANRLSVKQERWLREYGMLVRTAEINGADALGSCLGALDRVDAGGAYTLGSADARQRTAEWLADSAQRLSRARAALGFDSTDPELTAARAMILACDLVAGRDRHPREITTDQREQAQIESGLRIAGDLLAKHFMAERTPI